MKKSKVYPHSNDSSDQETPDPVQTTNEWFGEVLESRLRRQDTKTLIKAEERLRQKGLQVAYNSVLAILARSCRTVNHMMRLVLHSLLNGSHHSLLCAGRFGSAPALHLYPISCGCGGVVDVCSVCSLIICCSK